MQIVICVPVKIQNMKKRGKRKKTRRETEGIGPEKIFLFFSDPRSSLVQQEYAGLKCGLFDLALQQNLLV